MAKGIFPGSTDYSHQSLQDIISDLEDEHMLIASDINRIEKYIETLIEHNFWNTPAVSTHFTSIVNYSLKHFSTSQSELKEIANELKEEVKEHHVKRLQRISEVANEVHLKIVKAWQEDEHLKNYGNPDFDLVEKIHSYSKEVAINLLDMSNIAARLEDFVGKQNKLIVTPSERKIKTSTILKWSGVIIAFSVALFGNNWLGCRPNKIKSDVSEAKDNGDSNISRSDLIQAAKIKAPLQNLSVDTSNNEKKKKQVIENNFVKSKNQKAGITANKVISIKADTSILKNNVAISYGQQGGITANEVNVYGEKPILDFLFEALNDINPEIITEYKNGKNPVCVVANTYKIERILMRKNELLSNGILKIVRGNLDMTGTFISGGGKLVGDCVNDKEDLNGHLHDYDFYFLKNFK